MNSKKNDFQFKYNIVIEIGLSILINEKYEYFQKLTY